MPGHTEDLKSGTYNLSSLVLDVMNRYKVAVQASRCHLLSTCGAFTAKAVALFETDSLLEYSSFSSVISISLQQRIQAGKGLVRLMFSVCCEYVIFPHIQLPFLIICCRNQEKTFHIFHEKDFPTASRNESEERAVIYFARLTKFIYASNT